MTAPLGPDESLGTAPAPNCMLCGEAGQPHLQGLKDRLFGVQGTWCLSGCPACGLVWLNPQPRPEEIWKAYRRYYTHADEDPANRIPTRAPFFRRKIRRLYRWLLRRLGVMEARDQIVGLFLQSIPKGALLEIGCGSGACLAELAGQGWQVVGQDVDAESAQHALTRHGITVRVGELGGLNFENEAFDCILMNHVLEHLHDPVGVLRECHRILRPGGRLVAVTPNVASLGARTFGAHWRGIESPRHIHLFQSRTLAAVASMAGFNVFDTFTSVAHAELLAIQSLDIQARGMTVMGEEPSWPLERKAMAFQLREAWAFRRNPDLGEEAVLIARKET